MSSYRAVPADGCQVEWIHPARGGGERLALQWDNEAWTASVVQAHHRAEYVSRLSPTWRQRQLLLFRDLAEPDLWLATDGNGRWGEINGAVRSELDGIDELVVGDSPLQHATAVRRLALPVGDAAEVAVGEIDVETLEISVRRRCYRRLEHDTWEIVTAVDSQRLTLDEFGLPVAVDGWERVS